MSIIQNSFLRSFLGVFSITLLLLGLLILHSNFEAIAPRCAYCVGLINTPYLPQIHLSIWVRVRITVQLLKSFFRKSKMQVSLRYSQLPCTEETPYILLSEIFILEGESEKEETFLIPRNIWSKYLFLLAFLCISSLATETG